MKFALLVLGTAILTYLILATIFFNHQNLVIADTVKFQTENNEFSFNVIRSKGRDVTMMEKQFQTFKENYPDHKNLTLYRTTPKNYLSIRKWIGYKTNPAWTYPKLPFWKR